MCDVFIVAVN